MDSQVVKSSPNTGVETHRPKVLNTGSMNDQVMPPNVSQKIPGETHGSDIQLAGQKSEQEAAASNQEWKAGRKEWMIIIVLAIVSLMVALDATILVPVLPVSASKKGSLRYMKDNTFAGDRERSSWAYDRYLLDGNGLSLDTISLSTVSGFPFGRVRPPSVLPDLTGLFHNRHSTLLPVPEFQRAFGGSFNPRSGRWRSSRLGTGDFD